MSEKTRVDLSDAPQTMLATLYAKALDADARHPILGDRLAKQTVERIQYDWARTTITPRRAPSVTIRSAHFDNWVRQFLACHDTATVLHLGAGLDSRVFRIDPGPGVEWYDVDYPDVAALRAELLPEREHTHIVGAAVTDPAALSDVPTDRPVLMIAEGLTMYLTESDGVALLQRVVDKFPSGELQFDGFNRLGIRTQWTNTVVRRAGARLHWGIDGPDDIVDQVPGVRLLACESVFAADTFALVSPGVRLLGRLMGAVPGLAGMAQYHRYAFGGQR